MVKSVFKEICIMLLLCIAIVLILGVIFYDSIPSNKAVPNKLSSSSYRLAPFLTITSCVVGIILWNDL